VVQRIAAAVVLMAVLLVVLAAAVWIRAGTGPPVLYRSRRLGRHRRVFIMFKLRTMHVRRDGEAWPRTSMAQDQRLIQGGRWLRRYKIDELPQLWNIVRGEMAFVGQCMYHCSAHTTKPSRIRILRRAELETLLDQYPVITRRLLNLVSERFVRVLLDLEATSFRQLLPRIATLLLEYANGEDVEDLSHQEIAERLHVYRESVTAALGELRRAGIIDVARKRIRVLDRLRLERASRE